MTKKDYELIANQFNLSIREARATEGEGYHYSVAALQTLASCLSDELAGTNPKFNRNKFLEACGVELPAYVNNKGKTVNYS